MRNIFCALALLAALTMTAYSQKDLAGWQDTRWGMTEKELLETVKTGIKKLEKRATYDDGLYVDYTIPDYEIEGRKYEVSFQFDGKTNKLARVLIKDYSLQKVTIPQDGAFNALETLLTRKYGAAGYKKDDKGRDDMSLKRQWVLPTTTLELSYSWLGGELKFSLLTITYFPTKSGDLDKI